MAVCYRDDASRVGGAHTWGGGETADTADLKSASGRPECGFESRPPYPHKAACSQERRCPEPRHARAQGIASWALLPQPPPQPAPANRVRTGQLTAHRPGLLASRMRSTLRWSSGMPGPPSPSASDLGTFTARKERFQRGGWYWRAYRRRFGRLRRVYLGKSEQLSLDCLEAAAQRLASGGERASALAEPVMDAMGLKGGPEEAEVPGASARRRGAPGMSGLGGLGGLGGEAERHDAPRERPHLLATKVSRPLPPHDLVPRPRLTAALQRAATGASLTFIVAPAGSGKTTLLAEWAACAPRAGWAARRPGGQRPRPLLAHSPGRARARRSWPHWDRWLDVGGGRRESPRHGARLPRQCARRAGRRVPLPRARRLPRDRGGLDS
jgi:hypothetical protein